MSSTEAPVIAPFRGIRYQTNKISSLSKVVTPPYDVINEKEQAAYYDKDPYNMIRLDLNREAGDEKYQSARGFLLKWLEEGVLARDDKPALYLHDQTFTVAGTTYTRKGFVALRRLEEFGEKSAIKPHENTLDGPKEDRFKLFKACSAHLSQIFGLYNDPTSEVEAFFEGVREGTPEVDITTDDGERHRLWVCRDPIIAREVNHILSKQPIFIADGHHRYETSLRFSAHLREGRNDVDPREELFYTMMYLTNLDDPGLIILPIHRVLHSLPGFSKEAFISRLKDFFDVEPLPGFDLEGMGKRLSAYVMDYHAYLMSFGGGDHYVVRRRRHETAEGTALAKLNPLLQKLDVSVLHKLIFEEILSLSPESQARQENIDYYKNTESTKKALEDGRSQVGFFMNPMTVAQMKEVAGADLKLPQKSTFFYPKLLTGLVLNPILPREIVSFE